MGGEEGNTLEARGASEELRLTRASAKFRMAKVGRGFRDKRVLGKVWVLYGYGAPKQGCRLRLVILCLGKARWPSFGSDVSKQEAP